MMAGRRKRFSRNWAIRWDKCFVVTRRTHQQIYYIISGLLDAIGSVLCSSKGNSSRVSPGDILADVIAGRDGYAGSRNEAVMNLQKYCAP
jgi:hypothetical protein